MIKSLSFTYRVTYEGTEPRRECAFTKVERLVCLIKYSSPVRPFQIDTPLMPYALIILLTLCL